MTRLDRAAFRSDAEDVGRILDTIRHSLLATEINEKAKKAVKSVQQHGLLWQKNVTFVIAAYGNEAISGKLLVFFKELE